VPSPRVLQLGGDGAERRAEIGADQGEGGDCRDRNQCGNPYSIAVTPDWSLTKFIRSLRNKILLDSTTATVHSLRQDL
jgi:hypothetical protein